VIDDAACLQYRHNCGMERTNLFEILNVRGADALPFLHSQFAADLMALADGTLRWSALLNPQGRVLFVVAVIRTTVNDWSLLVPFQRGNELADILRRLVFRRKLRIEFDVDKCVVASATGLDTGIDGLHFAVVDRGATIVINIDAIDRFIAAGLVLIDETASGRHLAHSLRLERFDAFSVKKGCYPGQEIIARTHFLGRNKRALVRLQGGTETVWRSGDRLYGDGIDIGEIACSGQTTALAVLNQVVPPGTSLRLGPDRPVVMVDEAIEATT